MRSEIQQLAGGVGLRGVWCASKRLHVFAAIRSLTSVRADSTPAGMTKRKLELSQNLDGYDGHNDGERVSDRARNPRRRFI